jgi:hypothetical protein
MTNLVNGADFVGQVVGAATSTTVILGFTPRYVRTENETSSTGYELYGGTGKTMKVTSDGTKSYDTPSASNLVIIPGGFTVASAASDAINYLAIR